MSLRWENQGDGSCYVYSGRRRIGMIVHRKVDDLFVWMIDAVQGSRYQPATRGERKDLAGAKRALRSAWNTWIKERGLKPVPDPSI